MKVFISNEDLVGKLFVGEQQTKDILRDLLIIVGLVKKYGHKLDINTGYIQMVYKENPEIAKLYQILRSIGKTNIKDLDNIIKIGTKTYVQYKKEFTVTGETSVQKVLTEYIHKRFSSANITNNNTSVLGIDMKGEGYRYHRNLNNDLDTILGI